MLHGSFSGAGGCVRTIWASMVVYVSWSPFVIHFKSIFSVLLCDDLSVFWTTRVSILCISVCRLAVLDYVHGGINGIYTAIYSMLCILVLSRYTPHKQTIYTLHSARTCGLEIFLCVFSNLLFFVH